MLGRLIFLKFTIITEAIEYMCFLICFNKIDNNKKII